MDSWWHRLFLAVVLWAAAGAAVAQTCAAPGPWHPDLTGAPPTSADTCTLPDSVALYCDFLDSSQKGDAIWQITYAAGFTSTAIAISGGSATFNPVIYLMSGFRWTFFGTADVSVGISVAITAAIFVICLSIIVWVFKTGYRLKT